MNDDEKEIDYRQGYGCVTMVISLVAIVCSLAALSTVDINKDLKSSDCITITVLGTIVTLLVAWQIWQVIDGKAVVENIKRDYDSKFKEQILKLENRITYLEQQQMESGKDARMSDLEINGRILISNARGRSTHHDAFLALVDYMEAIKLFVSDEHKLYLDQISECITGVWDIINSGGLVPEGNVYGKLATLMHVTNIASDVRIQMTSRLTEYRNAAQDIQQLIDLLHEYINEWAPKAASPGNGTGRADCGGGNKTALKRNKNNKQN